MTYADKLGRSARRHMATWLSSETANFDAFVAITAKDTDSAEWPHAAEIVSKIPVYDGATLRRAASEPEPAKTVMAEIADALREGPGVIAIRAAMPDTTIVDDATAVFERLIEAEKASGEGAGDHFAKPGANDRVWNGLQKHCMADPANFAAYYASHAIALPCLAWLGPGYQMTAQVNRVNPGGAAQSAHRDYHLGFMSAERAMAFPAHCHELSPLMTLQGAVAHCDMAVESGPTKLLPYSQLYSHGYAVFGETAYQEHFEAHCVQLALQKGDAVFFNPALMHAAGENRTTDIYRMANLLQISSPFGRAMESLDRIAMAKALYPALLEANLSDGETANAVAACAEGYAFPTNLDQDPPVGGNVPQSQAEFMLEALRASKDAGSFATQLDQMAAKRLA